MCFSSVEMSKESKKFRVPDQLANLYDFANSLDVRTFTHHGVQHVQSDELTGPRELAAWMARRGLLFTGSKITAAMFDTALQLRTGVRGYLACNPGERAGPARIRGPGLAVGFPPYLVLLRVGFTLPPPLQTARCALTAPFHPYPRR